MCIECFGAAHSKAADSKELLSVSHKKIFP